jgi:AraC family transcriptional regulator of adaptative response/methylated-DNA-[protein]-cysteine methyltransferase
MQITQPELVERYYQALLERSEEFVGIFYAAVTSTSVFCIATCRARKPKKENVRFFTDFKDAMEAGFRPCKICRPTENAHEPPESVALAIALIRANPKARVGDSDLRNKGISPELVRRWFVKHHGMTFQAFQRMQRVNKALEELKGGKRATDTAFDTGYESLSGFGYTFKTLVGGPPKIAMQHIVILIHRFTTPLGPMIVCATDTGVCLLEFVSRRMIEAEFRDLQRLLKARIIAGENAHTRQTELEMSEYFRGERQAFSVPLLMPGTEFQRAVWNGLQRIPYGRTASYQDQAMALNRPDAIRAVASANGYNRISIIVPCHRVIGKDGSLVGYGGGLERKRWLLEHEMRHAKGQETDSASHSTQQRLPW